MAGSSGFKNRIDFIGLKDDHSGIVQLDSDMALTATAATTQAHIGLTLIQSFALTITPTKKNLGRSFSLDQDRDGSKIRKLADNFIVTDDTTSAEYYANGVAAASIAAAASEHNVVAIIYDVIDPDDATKMLVYLICGGFKEGSGTRTGKHQERSKPTMEFISKPAKATISIPIAMFDTVNVAAPGAPQMLDSGKEFTMLSLTAA